SVSAHRATDEKVRAMKEGAPKPVTPSFSSDPSSQPA
ncbi:MAG: hypothetical protein QOG89_2983, partial [Thermomicrobiales bacterium]|nr:hypothetical protein [Thermomicrobiales bacterium]